LFYHFVTLLMFSKIFFVLFRIKFVKTLSTNCRWSTFRWEINFRSLSSYHWQLRSYCVSIWQQISGRHIWLLILYLVQCLDFIIHVFFVSILGPFQHRFWERKSLHYTNIKWFHGKVYFINIFNNHFLRGFLLHILI
jgi:hypothetical protein